MEILTVSEIALPLFLRCRGDKRVQRFASENDLRNSLEAIDVENEEFEVWDNLGFRVNLRLTNPKSIRSLRIERSGDRPNKEEALQAFVEFARAEGAHFSLPPQTDDLLSIYHVLAQEVQRVWDKRPWIKKLLDRF